MDVDRKHFRGPALQRQCHDTLATNPQGMSDSVGLDGLEKEGPQGQGQSVVLGAQSLVG
jgi:hypothetical protein